MKKPSKTIRVVNFFVFFIFGFVTLFPLYDVIIGSLMSFPEYVRTPIRLFPREPTIEAYVSIFNDMDIITPFMNTLFVTVVGTTLSITVTSIAAYALSRRYLYGRRFVMLFVLFTMLFNGGLIPTYMVMLQLGLINSLWVIILLPLVNSFYLIIMRTYFASIPDSLEESAKLDGANDFTIFFRIMLPMSKPIVATMVLFISVDRWSDLFTGLVFITRSEYMVIQVFLYRMLARITDGAAGAHAGAFIATVAPQTQRMAAIVITTIPILLVYPFLQKYFAKGVMLGSIKE